MPVGHPIWSGCGEAPGGTVRTVLWSSWRVVGDGGIVDVPGWVVWWRQRGVGLETESSRQGCLSTRCRSPCSIFRGLPRKCNIPGPIVPGILLPTSFLSASMADASWLASGKDTLDGSVVPWGVAAPKGLDRGGSSAFVGFTSVRSPRLIFCGEV